MNQLDFNGRHAVVTGGATGLGYAIAAAAARLGRQRHACGTATGERRSSAAVDARAPRRTRWRSTSPQQQSVQAGRAATLAHAQRVDALVNSAGITGPNTKLWDYPVDAWRQVIDVNLNGLFHCCREIVPLMRDAGYGRIVNIASVAGKDGNPNASAYSASKAAVIALTKSLGKELADTGVRVNCVTPAAVKTAIFDQMSAGAHPVHAVEDPDGPLRHARGSGGDGRPGCAPRNARSPPARCSTCRADAPRTDDYT